jgi:hypothetical protein
LLSSCPPWITKEKTHIGKDKKIEKNFFFCFLDLSPVLLLPIQKFQNSSNISIWLYIVSRRMALKRINKELLELEKE